MTLPALDAGLLWARETSEYDVLFRGEAIGRYRIELEPDEAAGEIVVRALYEDVNVRTHATVRLERGTLRPRGSFKEIRAPQGEFQVSGTYRDDAIRIEAVTPNGPQRLEVPLVAPVFDNDTLLAVMRAIDLPAGRREGLEVANLDNGRTYFCWIEGFEPPAAPEGPAARGVLLTFETADSHEMTYAKDAPHALLRYDNRNVLFELARFERLPA